MHHRGIHISGNLGESTIFSRSQRWVAENKKTGLFMGYGPGFNKALKLNDVSILDIAPTILKSFNIDVPKEMDGRVLDEIFKE